MRSSLGNLFLLSPHLIPSASALTSGFCKGNFMEPAGCRMQNGDTTNCTYYAEWEYRPSADDIAFRIETKYTAPSDWVGIVFATSTTMVRVKNNI